MIFTTVAVEVAARTWTDETAGLAISENSLIPSHLPCGSRTEAKTVDWVFRRRMKPGSGLKLKRGSLAPIRTKKTSVPASAEVVTE